MNIKDQKPNKQENKHRNPKADFPDTGELLESQTCSVIPSTEPSMQLLCCA